MILEVSTDTIIVFTAATAVDTYGNKVDVPSSEGTTIRCRVTPHSNTRDRTTSRVHQSFKVITGDVSTTRWISVQWNNKYYIVDEWKQYKSSPATQHTSAILRAES